jgi:hypothetical protein
MDVDAMTVTGTTWRERLADTANLSATGVAENPVILSKPRRAVSGVDVLQSNWFESAVVKISGMPEKQVDFFDEQAAFVLYFETEEDANEALLDIDLLPLLRQERAFPEAELRAMAVHNSRLLGINAPAGMEPAGVEIAHPDRLPHPVGQPTDLPLSDPATFAINLDSGTVTSPQSLEPSPYEALFDEMVRAGTLKIAIVIAAQGPVAFGMPEMFTPMQHINANRSLRKLATLISDGRYSGVSYGAAVGHVTPEAARGGDVLRLQTGDLLHLRFRARRIDLLDPAAFVAGAVEPAAPSLLGGRSPLADERTARLTKRQRLVAASNRMTYCTDASRGVVPQAVWDECDHTFWDVATVSGVTG